MPYFLWLGIYCFFRFSNSQTFLYWWYSWMSLYSLTIFQNIPWIAWCFNQIFTVEIGTPVKKCKGSKQNHYREVPRWGIFMEQELRFGLDLGWLAVLKKRVWADYEQLLRVIFSCFHGQIFFYLIKTYFNIKKLRTWELKQQGKGTTNSVPFSTINKLVEHFFGRGSTVFWLNSNDRLR